MATVKAKQADGTEIDVELPAGYVSPQEIAATHVPKDFMQSEIERRLRGKADPDKLLTDEAFRAKALETWGVKPGKSEKPNGEDVEKLFGEWGTKHLEPVKQALTKAETRAKRALERDRDYQIVQAARDAGVKEQFLKAPGPKAKPLIVKMFEDEAGFSEEHDDWFAKDGDGFAFSTQPTKDRPFRSIGEMVTEWSKDKANADWISDQRQRGAGLGTPGQGSAGQHVISREDARNLTKYEAAKEAARKAGVELQIAP